MNPFLVSPANSFPLFKSPSSHPRVLHNFTSVQNIQAIQKAQTIQSLQNQSTLLLLEHLQSSPNPRNFNNFSSLLNTNSMLKQSQISPQSNQNSFTEYPIEKYQRMTDNSNTNNEVDQLKSVLLAWKVQNNIQADLYKTQFAQLLEMQKQLDLKMKENERLSSKLMENEAAKSPPNKVDTVVVPVQQTLAKKTLKGQIRDIIQYVLSNFGKISDSQIEQEKGRYQDNKDLQTVFDLLLMKYQSTIKTKEEMIKYTLRKAFKFIKNQLKKETHSDAKEASAILCNRYFKDYKGTLPEFGDEEDFLKFVLPFRKSSKNKTMNSNFINEVFASNEFLEDYKEFLKELDDILETDNNGKIDRFVIFIEEVLKKNKIQEIKKYKRIPWPDVWISNTKKIAIDLPESGAHDSSEPLKKRVKKEDETNSHPHSPSTSNGSSSQSGCSGSSSNC